MHLLAARRFQNKVIAVIALQSRDGRRCRPEHANAFMPRLLEPAPEFTRPGQRLIQFLAADEHIRNRAVRRIVHPGAKLQLFFVEPGKVVPSRKLHRIVSLKISLQHNLPRRLAPPRPRTVSRSSRPIRACGNMPCSNSSSFSDPVPTKYTYSLPQCAHLSGMCATCPQ